MKAQLPKFVKYDPAHVRALRQFVSIKQLKLITDLTYEEEGEHFVAKLKEYAERVATMPKTYEQDGKGDEAIVFALRCFAIARSLQRMHSTSTDLTTDELPTPSP